METIAIGMTSAQFISANNNNNLYRQVFVNIKEFGAVGDGVTDDTVAIQNAINYAYSSDICNVFCPPGKYLIAGPLKTNVGGVSYNSQLYIPADGNMSTTRKGIKIFGAGCAYWPTDPFASAPTQSTKGTIFISNIDGTGELPAIIASKGLSGRWGPLNYTTTTIQGIDFRVKSNNTTTGPTMSAINMIYSAMTHIDDVICQLDCIVNSSAFPTAQTFGLILGLANDNMIATVDRYRVYGYNVGLAASEGVAVNSFVAWGCHIGLMGIRNTYSMTIKNCALHACNYAISAQIGDIPNASYPPEKCYFDIDYFSLEPKLTSDPDGYWPTWTTFQDVIYDPNNYLIGRISGTVKGVTGSQGLYFTRQNGGRNLLFRNAHKNSDYCWYTADRPTSPGLGVTGFNMTTNKKETWNGTTWNDLY